MATFQIMFNSEMEEVACEELTLSCLKKKVISRFPSLYHQQYLFIGKKTKNDQVKGESEDNEVDKEVGDEVGEEIVSFRTEKEFQSFVNQTKFPLQLKIELESDSYLHFFYQLLTILFKIAMNVMNSSLIPKVDAPIVIRNDSLPPKEVELSARLACPKKVQLSARVAWAKTPMTTEELHCWVEIGIREIQSDVSCGICFEEHQELISNFACFCAPITCTSCNAKIDRCPICHKGKYRRILNEEIGLLLKSGFSTSARKIIMRKCLKEGYSLPFCFDQLICHASDIDEVITTLGPESGRNNANYMNSIYCLSIDYWTLQFTD